MNHTQPRWKPHEIGILKSGLTKEEIARLVHRTERAVEVKMLKLKIKP